jgi:uncharacterized repeat protein (TIGR01451 family)
LFKVSQPKPCKIRTTNKPTINQRTIPMKKGYLGLLIGLVSFATQAQEVKFEWAKAISGTSIEIGTSITTDVAGNIYTVGYFSGICDFDPGTSTYNLSSKGFEDIFIQKLDSNGSFIWAKSIGGTSNDYCSSITIDTKGNLLLTGTFRSKVDFDPSTDTFYLSTTGSVFVLKLNSKGEFLWAKSVRARTTQSIIADVSGNVLITGAYGGTVDFDPGKNVFNLTTTRWGNNIFILKLDHSGNFVWAKANSGTSYDYSIGNSIVCDALKNVYITGFFNGIVDFDPSTATKNMGAAGRKFIFIQKLDSLGNLVWIKSTEGNGHGHAYSMTIDVFDNIIISGDFTNIVDFDPGSATFNLSSNHTWMKNVFILKLDTGGNFIWAKSFGGTRNDYSFSVTSDHLGNIYTTGYYGGAVDFDPGADSSFLTALDTNDIYVLKLDTGGNFVWAQSAGGTQNDRGISVTTSRSGQVYTTGYYQGISDFNSDVETDYLTSKGNKDAFILKLKQGWDSCTDLSVIHDSISHFSCLDSGYISVHAKNGSSPYSYSWNVKGSKKDSSIAIHKAGIYTVNVIDSIGCSRSSSMLINGPSTKSGFDLNVNLIATPFRPRRSNLLILDAFNSGCDTVLGYLRIVLDTMVTLDSASIAPDSIKGDTLTWNFSSLKFGSAHLTPRLFLTTNRSARRGDFVDFEVKVLPLKGDYDSTNNIKHYRFTVRTSYDPNDKNVYPKGKCAEHYVKIDEPLTYTIRFQNTGDADAIDIYLLDEISQFLDLNTLKVLGQSHKNLITEVLPNNVLKFGFDNIYLPDSNSNETESHGYVVYQISPKIGVSNGSIVNNKAEIYFDYNPAVATNSVFNTLVDTIPKLTFTDVQTACKSFTWIDGRTYTSNNNTASYIIASFEGCDSVVTLNLNINKVDTTLTLSNGTLTANTSNAKYQWVDCDNAFAPIPNETNQTFAPWENGFYAALINVNNCTDTSVCYFVKSNGVSKLQFAHNIHVYPNPNKGEINIDFGQNIGSKTVKISDLLGRTVYQNTLDQKLLKIQIDAQPGIYILSVENEYGSKKIIKLISK